MIKRHYLYTILSKFIFLDSSKKNLRVLAYHTVPEQNKFEEQIQYLIKNFEVISVKELHSYFFKNKPLPPNSLLITFDDGDVSVLENGLPVLEKYDLASVLFIISGLIDSSNTFWCRWVENVFEREGKSYAEARKKIKFLKSISNYKRMEYLKTLSEFESRQLSSNELCFLQSKKMYIANHTHTHPMINKCTKFEIEQELANSHQLFKKLNLDGYEVFAYPNGNWDANSENILEENGIKMAFLFDHKLNEERINPLRISRLRVDADTEINEFKVKVSGLHSKIMSFR